MDARPDQSWESIRWLFTNRHCRQLALELHETTGWPIIVVVEDREAVHFGVISTDGSVLDIEGSHDRFTWIDRWSPERTFGYGPSADLRTCDPENARAIARAIIPALLRAVAEPA